NIPPQGPDLARRFQNPREQSHRVDSPTGTLHNAVPHLGYQNAQRRTSSSISSSHISPQQSPEQEFAAQMPQLQLSVNPNQIAQPILRSNHNLIPTNHTASNLYPGAVMSA